MIGRVVAIPRATPNARIIHSRCKALLHRRILQNPGLRNARKRVANSVVAAVSLTPPMFIVKLISRTEKQTMAPNAIRVLPGHRLPCDVIHTDAFYELTESVI